MPRFCKCLIKHFLIKILELIIIDYNFMRLSFYLRVVASKIYTKKNLGLNKSTSTLFFPMPNKAYFFHSALSITLILN